MHLKIHNLLVPVYSCSRQLGLIVTWTLTYVIIHPLTKGPVTLRVSYFNTGISEIKLSQFLPVEMYIFRSYTTGI